MRYGIFRLPNVSPFRWLSVGLRPIRRVTSSGSSSGEYRANVTTPVRRAAKPDPTGAVRTRRLAIREDAALWRQEFAPGCTCKALFLAVPRTRQAAQSRQHDGQVRVGIGIHLGSMRLDQLYKRSRLRQPSWHKPVFSLINEFDALRQTTPIRAYPPYAVGNAGFIERCSDLRFRVNGLDLAFCLKNGLENEETWFIELDDEHWVILAGC
jgi:hypothetical protein